MTYDGSTAIVYLDGVSVDSRSISLNTRDDIFRIGWSGAGYDYLGADFDDVRVYDRALTPTEIAELADGTRTVNGNPSTFALADDLDVANDLTISAGALDASSSDIYVAGDWANTGTFTAGTRTVVLDGAGTQAVSGSTTFYNLEAGTSTARTVTFESGQTQTITNDLTLTGAESELLTLAPSQAATEWFLAAPESQTIQYVTATYSNASGGSVVIANDGTSQDGAPADTNTNWVFEGFAVSGTAYSGEGTGPLGSTTVSLLVNGGSKQTTTTNASGGFSFAVNGAVEGDILTVYLDNDGGAQGVTVSTFGSDNISGLDIYQRRLITRHEDAGPLTNADLDVADTIGDSDISAIYTVDGSGNLTVSASNELFIWAGHTYAPGADISVDDIDINGTLTLARPARRWQARGTPRGERSPAPVR